MDTHTTYVHYDDITALAYARRNDVFQTHRSCVIVESGLCDYSYSVVGNWQALTPICYKHLQSMHHTIVNSKPSEMSFFSTQQ